MKKHFYNDSQVQAIRDRAIVWTRDDFAQIGIRDSGFGGTTSVAHGSYGWSDGVLYWSVPSAEKGGQIRLHPHADGLDARADKLERIVKRQIVAALRDYCALLEANVLDA